MEFEWSEAKRRQNLTKHGLDFVDVALFAWANAVIAEDVRIDYGETRFRAFGVFNGRLHMVVFARRREKFRVISFRRASRKEVRRYGETQE
jgi:uncharacterized DUF497 family protein